MPDIEFRQELVIVTDAQLAAWTVERSGDGTPVRISGPCPVCQHDTWADIELDIVAEAAAVTEEAVTLAPGARITRVVACQCGRTHRRPAAAAAAAAEGTPPPPAVETWCGRTWSVTVPLVAVPGEQEVRAGVPAMLPAATYASGLFATEETRIRTAAEKWTAGVAALLSLFGLSGVVAGKDAFEGIPTAGLVLGAIFGLLALFAAVGAIVESYRAAYGWPEIVDISDDERLGAWYARRREAAKTAARGLREGVQLACWAVVALACALAVIWFWPREDPKPLVKVTLTDDSFVCGTLLASKDDGQVRVRRSNGDVKPLPAAQVKRVDIATKCAS